MKITLLFLISLISFSSFAQVSKELLSYRDVKEIVPKIELFKLNEEFIKMNEELSELFYNSVDDFMIQNDILMAYTRALYYVDFSRALTDQFYKDLDKIEVLMNGDDVIIKFPVSNRTIAIFPGTTIITGPLGAIDYTCQEMTLLLKYNTSKDIYQADYSFNCQ